MPCHGRTEFIRGLAAASLRGFLGPAVELYDRARLRPEFQPSAIHPTVSVVSRLPLNRRIPWPAAAWFVAAAWYRFPASSVLPQIVECPCDPIAFSVRWARLSSARRCPDEQALGAVVNDGVHAGEQFQSEQAVDFVSRYVSVEAPRTEVGDGDCVAPGVP